MDRAPQQPRQGAVELHAAGEAAAGRDPGPPGADHLDAPALGGLTNMAGEFAPHSEHGDRDINDVYVFPAPDGGNRTVLAMTVNPAINLFGGNFGTNVRYTFNIDRNGDNLPDTAYVLRYGSEDGAGNQRFKITKYTGSRARSLTAGDPVVQGFTNSKNKVRAEDGLWAWTGVRSDPFFFDLDGFINILSTESGKSFLGCTGSRTDFFAGQNVSAIVLELPAAMLRGDSSIAMTGYEITSAAGSLNPVGWRSGWPPCWASTPSGAGRSPAISRTSSTASCGSRCSRRASGRT